MVGWCRRKVIRFAGIRIAILPRAQARRRERRHDALGGRTPDDEEHAIFVADEVIDGSSF
jgi:hypothetical protein